MKTICKPRVLFDGTNETHPWNVQLWNSSDGGITWEYTGQGKFFENTRDDEMEKYVFENWQGPKEFPIITPEIQAEFEKKEEPVGYIPISCGCRGRNCRVMNHDEGANHMICMNCELSHFARKKDLENYLKS